VLSYAQEREAGETLPFFVYGGGGYIGSACPLKHIGSVISGALYTWGLTVTPPHKEVLNSGGGILYTTR
jgi:hypothetical protein